MSFVQFKLILPILALIMIGSYVPSTSAEEVQITNGCGPIGFGALVPDQSLISSCKFTNACDAHDTCYGKCLAGGELYGQATCDDDTAKEERRSVCDGSLRAQIAVENGDRKICKFYATIFHAAVAKFGDKFFQGLQASGDANFKEYRRFAEYVGENPSAFDLGEAENLINQALSNDALRDTKIEFESYTPALLIKQFDEANNLVVTEVLGK